MPGEKTQWDSGSGVTGGLAAPKRPPGAIITPVTEEDASQPGAGATGQGCLAPSRALSAVCTGHKRWLSPCW